MKTKWIVAALGVLAVILIGWTISSAHSAPPAPISTTLSSTPTPGGTATKTYRMADVATHNSEGSCWTAINGKVYDVTNWISQHPGGPSRILGLCGIDGSSAFNDQHGGQARPASELATFYIGNLAQ